jgi:hypothetical protein
MPPRRDADLSTEPRSGNDKVKEKISTTKRVPVGCSSSSSLRLRHLKKLVRHINRKDWWHVPPADPRAYQKRGKFLASTFREAEFYGRPYNNPERVVIASPLVGDNDKIEKTLIGGVESHPNISIRKRFSLDAKLCRAALLKGFDSIVLLTPMGFRALKYKGKLRCLRNLIKQK